jgi:hypothetical protein
MVFGELLYRFPGFAIGVTVVVVVVDVVVVVMPLNEIST